MNKLIVVALVGLLFVSCVVLFTLQETEKQNNVHNPSTGEKWDSVEDYIYKNNYQGPIRPTDNEEHFRKMGETIPIRS